MVVAQGSEAKGPENSVVHVLSQFTGAGAHLRVCLTYIDTIPKFGHRNSPRKAINDIIKFWRSEACSFVELATDHALFAGIGTAIGAAPAGAQQTPSTYCKTLPATSCEVLNVEPVPSGSAALGFLIKMCRNQSFETRLITMSISGTSRLVGVGVLPGTFSGLGWGNLTAGIADNTAGTGVPYVPAGAFQGSTSSTAGVPYMNFAASCI